MATIQQKIQSIRTEIAKLDAIIDNTRNAWSNRKIARRSRGAFRANLTRLTDKLIKRGAPAPVVQLGKGTAKTPIAPAPVVKKGELIDTDKDQNVVIKSAVTAASLGWNAPAIKPVERPFKKSQYYEVLVVHSHTNFTS